MIHAIVFVFVFGLCYALPGMCYVLCVVCCVVRWCMMRGPWWSVFMRFFAR